MIKFIIYILFDINNSLFFKFKYLLEKILKYPYVILNKVFKLNLIFPYIIKKDFIIYNSDWKWLIQAKTWNDYMISIPNEYSFRKYFLKMNEWKIFLDIWAHIWKWSILLSNKKNIKTYSFEPNPITYKYLNKNIVLNHLSDKIQPLNYWIAEKEWSMKFHMHSLSAMSWLVNESDIHKYNNNEIIDVQITSIDTFIKNNSLNVWDIDLIKIDVEWYEENVISWMHNLLSNSSDHLKIICEITVFDKVKIINKILSYWFKYKPLWEQDFYFFKENENEK